MRRALAALALFVGLVGLAGCRRSGANTLSRMTLTGSSTVAPLMTEIAKAYEQRHPQVRIDVQMGGSSRGVHDARQGLVDVGMASRGPKADEGDLQFHTIALDGIALIVNVANPIKGLTDPQVVDIYTGHLTNWKDLGGPDAPILVVTKAEGRSTLELFCDHFKLKPAQIKAAVVIGDNQQGIKTVEGDKTAIGYVSIGTAESSIREGSSIKLLDLNGIQASRATVKAATYPLSRPLNLVTRMTLVGVPRDLIDFAQSRAVESIVEDQGFVVVTR